jgi:hypothetical protein
MKKKFLIVISFYAGRDPSSLSRLLRDLDAYRSLIRLVINTDNLSSPASLLDYGVETLLTENHGMNIGAWHKGFSRWPDADYYLFLQDECYLKKDGFLREIVQRMESDTKLQFLGESLNYRWDRPWRDLLLSPLNQFSSGHYINHQYSKRVDTYLHNLVRWGVDPGPSGLHLRSLVWALSGRLIRELKNFPIGTNRGECIAAEIAVSRKVRQLGYEIAQIGSAPFTYFGHVEWRDDGIAKRMAF